MFPRPAVAFLLVLALCSSVCWLHGETPQVTGKLQTEVKKVSEKRFKRSIWSGGSQSSNLQSKRFALQNYDKHFSSLGRKRAPIDLSERRDKELYRTPEVKNYDKRAVEFSRWSQQMARLQQEARISTDSRVQEILDRQHYQMMMQDTPKAYADLAEELSMRDLNRFAFRRNRSAAKPDSAALRAGGGEDNSLEAETR